MVEFIIELDLSMFNIENVTSMDLMFSNCSSLRLLDLRSFKTSNVTTIVILWSECY